MTDGTEPLTQLRFDPSPQLHRVMIQFTDKFDKYCIRGGPQFNAGESASVPEAEAEQLVRVGAAVRLQEPAASGAGKALIHPNSDKMVHATKHK